MIQLHIIAGAIFGALIGAAIWDAAEHVINWKDTNR